MIFVFTTVLTTIIDKLYLEKKTISVKLCADNIASILEMK